MKICKLLMLLHNRSLLTCLFVISFTLFVTFTPYLVDAQDKSSSTENLANSKKISNKSSESLSLKGSLKDEVMNKDSSETYEMVATTEPFTDKFGPVIQANLGASLLTNESCQLVAQKDVEQTDQLQLSDIVCNGTLIANEYSQAGLPEVSELNLVERLTSSVKQFKASDPYKDIADRMDCGDPRWLKDQGQVPYLNPAILAFPCTLKNGGWPNIVILRSEGKKIFIAEGPPVTLPNLIKAITISGKFDIKDIELSEYSRKLRDVWGKPVRFYNPKDQLYFDQLVVEARVANSVGKYDESEALFRRALQIQSQLLGEDSELLVDTILDLALNVSNNGQFDEAGALFRRVEAILQKSLKENSKARLSQYLGYDASNRRDYAIALKYADEAVLKWRKVNEDSDDTVLEVLGEKTDTLNDLNQGELAMALNFEAQMSLKNGEKVSAYAQASEALKLIDGLDNVPQFWNTEILITLGDISLAQEKLAVAVKYYETALTYQKNVFGEDTRLSVTILAKLGQGLQKEGLNTNAINTFRQSIAIAKRIPRGQGSISMDQLTSYAKAASIVAPSLKLESERQGLYAEIFDAYQLQHGSAIQKTMALTAAKLRSNNKEMNDVVSDLQSLERLRDADRAQLASETSRPEEQRSKIIEDKLNSDLKQKIERITFLRAEIQGKFPEYVDLVKPKPVKLNELQSFMEKDEAVAIFLLGEQDGLLQLVTRSSMSLVEIPKGIDDIAETIKSLRLAFEIQNGTVHEFNLKKSNELYKQLFSKVQDTLNQTKHLIIVPIGPLLSFPFSILVTQPVEGTDYAKADWLINHLAISYAPSLRSFYDKRSSIQLKKATKPFIGFGNPLLGKSQSAQVNRVINQPAPIKTNANKKSTSSVASAASIKNGKTVAVVATATIVNEEEPPPVFAFETCRSNGPIPRELLMAMPSLPETSQELSNVAKLMSGKNQPALFLGADATETQVRNQALVDYRVIYFATHGLLPGELRCQSEPAIVMTPPSIGKKNLTKFEDGLLEASEISEFKLNADLVVLSACNTAGGNGKLGGESLSGLTEAFFFAGAQSLLVSHWSVPSNATMQLMDQLFANLGPEMSNGTAMSLQKAQMKLSSTAQTAHPVFWGAFVLIGDGAAEGTGIAKAPAKTAQSLAPGVSNQQSLLTQPAGVGVL
jgi:CHAT domain-containing protein